MKHLKKIIGIAALAAVITFAFAACGGSGGSGGTFTITGIPAQHNGKYAAIAAATAKNGDTLVGYYLETPPRRAKISNGSATIPVWLVLDGGKTQKYSGTDTVTMLLVGIYNEEKVTTGFELPVQPRTFSNVNFVKGSAAANW